MATSPDDYYVPFNRDMISIAASKSFILFPTNAARETYLRQKIQKKIDTEACEDCLRPYSIHRKEETKDQGIIYIQLYCHDQEPGFIHN
jgi:hypothetical protein